MKTTILYILSFGALISIVLNILMLSLLRDLRTEGSVNELFDTHGFVLINLFWITYDIVIMIIAKNKNRRGPFIFATIGLIALIIVVLSILLIGYIGRGV